MPLKLMYITNRPDVARIAEQAGVNRVFVDMEFIGKDARQGGMNTVQNHHTIEDVKCLRSVLTTAELLVRVNPIHDALPDYPSSETEIDAAIDAGADIIMLPYFKTADELRRAVDAIGGRARFMPLLETPEAAEGIDEILALPGIDEIHIGINDLALGYGKRFMFEMVSDGTVERLCLKCRLAGIPYGFGGIASIGSGALPAEVVLKEHYRLGSSFVILSRSFCNVEQHPDLAYIREKFETGVRSIRSFEREIAAHTEYFETNRRRLVETVAEIVGS